MNIPHLPDVTHGPRLVERTRAISSLLADAAERADVTGCVAPETMGLMQHAGLLRAPLPCHLGGVGLASPEGVESLATILRLIGRADLVMARLYEGHVNGVALVCRYGTDDQVGRFAAAIVAGGVSAVWAAEDASGLRVVPDGDGFRLVGRKILASGAGIVTDPVVTARLAGTNEPLMILTPLADVGIDLSGWTAHGMRASATGTVDLTGVRIGADRLMGQSGDYVAQPYFSGGAWRFCAAHLGGAERLIDLYREHLVARARADDPFQVERVAQCVAATLAARLCVEKAAHDLAWEEDDDTALVAFANLTRLVTERACMDVLQAVQRGVGLQAFVRPSALERVARDLATYLRQPAPDLAMVEMARFVVASSRSTGDLWSPDAR